MSSQTAPPRSPAPRTIFALLVIYLLVGILYSTTTPLFEAPDEQWHYAFVQHVAQGRGLPVQSLPLQHLARQEGSQPPLYYLLAAALTFWIDTSDFPGIVWENPHYGYDVPGIVNDNKNLFIHTAQEQFPYHNTALAMHLARLLSLALGALAVYFTYCLTLALVPPSQPARSDLRSALTALAAAAFVAFNPQFLFISSAVSNDSAIAAASALTLFLLVRAFSIPPTLRASVFIGIACGLGALAKVSGVAMLPLALLVLAYLNRTNPRQFVLQIAAASVSFALVAGWWYLRNLALYGELTGTTRMIEIFGGRAAPLTVEQWRAQLDEVFETFWIGMGWGNLRAPEWVYLALGLVTALGLAGLVYGFVRRRASADRRSERATLRAHAALLVPAAWTLIVAASLVRWMMLTQAPHGRLFFPALPALAALMAIGWMLWLPPRVQSLAFRLAPLPLLALALAAPFLWLAPAYAAPPALTDAEIGAVPARVDIRYGAGLMLLGSRITPHPLDPLGALQVELYWRVLAPMSEDYTLNLAALDENYRVVGSRNTYPGHGTLPTRLMQPGQIIADTYWLPLKTRVPSGSVQVTVFERTTQQDLPAFDPAGNEITPIVNTFQLK